MKSKSRMQLVLLTLLFVVAIPLSAYGADGQIKISQSTGSPINITQPGSYVLTSNFVVTTSTTHGISIGADNVTLNLNGHAIIGPGKEIAGGDGIYAYEKHNIAVMNGTVRGFGVRGIYISGTNNQVKDIRAYSNGGNGIMVYSSTGSSSSTITNCTAHDNGDNGIFATYSTVTNCTANKNDSNGIYASYSTVTNCTADENDNDGIYALYSTITNCTAYKNTEGGIDTNYSTVTNSTASHNDSFGIRAYYSPITDCTAYLNGSHGISTYSCAITNCSANYNKADGICAVYSSVVNCMAYKNDSHGIYAYNRCRIEGNNLRNNGAWGLYLTGLSNYAIKNVASDNASGNFFATGTYYMPTTGDNANYGF